MDNSGVFLKRVLDSVHDNIVVINSAGSIEYVNNGWKTFAESNEYQGDADWAAVNYLDECYKSPDINGSCAAEGIRSVIKGDLPVFYHEYACHSPDEKRWFMMRVNPFFALEKDYFVISHHNITERKLQEKQLRDLSNIDSLTGIANRRSFNTFLNEQWQRCAEFRAPISLIIIDLDDFKLLNDNYGHQAGDECLMKVTKLLQSYAQAPIELCARYGGEEFVMVWCGITIAAAKARSRELLQKIADLKIPNYKSVTQQYLTASMGLAAMIPTQDTDAGLLIGKADSLLYQAKANGKNRVES